MKQITVAIPTYNGMDYIEELLQSLFAQEGIQLEIIICDSSSSDGTWESISKYKNLIALQIPKHEFSHGGTRQKMVLLASNEIIVFLSQDALPVSNHWALDHWDAHNLSPKKVAAILGKQTPREFAHAPIAQRILRTFRFLGNDFGVTIYSENPINDRKFGKSPLTFLSDVHVSYKKSVLAEAIPFKNVNYAEDQLIASDLINAGFQIAYFPQISVVHSNDVSVRDYRKRIEEETVGLHMALGLEIKKLTLKRAIKEFFTNSIHDYMYLFKKLNKRNYAFICRELFLAPIFELENLRGIKSAYRNQKINSL